jgi:hypothetical protein
MRRYPWFVGYNKIDQLLIGSDLLNKWEYEKILRVVSLWKICRLIQKLGVTKRYFVKKIQ